MQSNPATRVMEIADLNWRLRIRERQIWNTASLAVCCAGGWLVARGAGDSAAGAIIGWALALATLISGVGAAWLASRHRALQLRLQAAAASMGDRVMPLSDALGASPLAPPLATGPAALFSGRGIGVDHPGLALCPEGRLRSR